MRIYAGWLIVGVMVTGWAAPVWAQETGWIQGSGAETGIFPASGISLTETSIGEDVFRFEASGDEAVVPEPLQKYADSFDNNSSDSGHGLGWQEAARSRIRVARLLSTSA